MEEDLATIQKNIENAVKKVVHLTKAQRERKIMSIPENVRMREEAAARCTTKIKRRVLRRQVKGPLEKIYTNAMCFSGTFHGTDGISKFVEDRETGLLRETGRCPEERDQKLPSNRADLGDVEVVCILYYSAPGEGKKPRKLRRLHMGGVNGISCQHLQVLTTNLLQKHWEWQEERNPVMKHGTVVRPTMYMASLDIKTAFDEAKPKHVARILDDHNTHGWLIAALSREMSAAH